MSNAALISYSVFWVLLLPIIPAAILFFRWRFRHPIKGRFPRLALLQAFFAVLVCIELGVAEVLNATGCFFSQVAANVVSNIFLWIFNYRLFLLLFSYKITEDIARIQDIRTWVPNWFTRHRYVMNTRFALKASVFIFLIYGIGFTIAAFSTMSVGCDTSQFQPMLILVLTLSIFVVMVSITIALQIWKFPQDAFGIKEEFKYVAFTVLGYLVIFLALSITVPESITQMRIIVGLLPHAVLLFSIFHPCWKVYKLSKFTEPPRSVTLRDWLNRRDGPPTFMKYLQSEFSTENLHFWVEVNSYRNNISMERGDEILGQANRIFKQFIALDAPCMINLPAQLFEAIGNAMENLPQSLETAGQVFDEAQAEIFRLMESDSFQRFQRTPAYVKANSNASMDDPCAEVELLISQQKTPISSSISTTRSLESVERGVLDNMARDSLFLSESQITNS